MRNKIADIVEVVYVTEVKILVHDELQQRCEGCEMEDPSQLHHDCLTMDEEEIWGPCTLRPIKFFIFPTKTEKGNITYPYQLHILKYRQK